MYDSLGRLTRAKNPEQAAAASITGTDPVTGNTQWSLSYSYDAAGNLTSKTDARNVTAAYTYDPLNRVRTNNYSDATPDVTRYYDLAALGRGRAWKSEAAGVARTTVSEYDEEGRPEAYSQQFWVNGAWGASFPVTRLYDKAGHVTSQTYPSGRTVSYAYDRLGRPASFSGNLGDSVNELLRTSAAESVEVGGELAGELEDLEDFDPYDSTHLFWEQLKQLGFAFREIWREDVLDEEIKELLKASELILAILSRIQRRKEGAAKRLRI